MVSITISHSRQEHLQLNGALSAMKEQVDDHLTAINENTSEIQCNFEHLCLIEAKMEKIAQRIDQIQLFLQKTAGFASEERPRYEVEALTPAEKDVFLYLYTLEEKKGAVTYADLGRYCCLPEDVVQSYVASLIQKGVPITKRYVNDKAYIRLDKAFKRVQAQQNILKIEQKLMGQWG